MLKLKREGHPGEEHDVVAVKCEGETEEDVAELSMQCQIKVKTEPAIDINHIIEEVDSDTDAVEFKVEEIDGCCRVGKWCEARGSGVGCEQHGAICAGLRCNVSDSIDDKRGVSNENVDGVDAGGFDLGFELQLKSEEIDLGCDTIVADPIGSGELHWGDRCEVRGSGAICTDLRCVASDSNDDKRGISKENLGGVDAGGFALDFEFQLKSEEIDLGCDTIVTDTYSGVKPHTCKTCVKKFSMKWNPNHTREKPHTCNVCNKNFAFKHYLRVHQSLHSKEKPHACNICDMKFACKIYLNRHLLLHKVGKRHACTQCPKKFSLRSHLSEHMLTHTGERPHTCKICDKKFVQKGTLDRHMTTHSDAKPHSCTICNKNFSHRGLLKRHMLIHTGEKPYTCTVCNKKIARKSNFTEHMLMHSREKLHACMLCDQMFATKGSLTLHMATHCERNPHTCTFCQCMFARKVNLIQHLSTHIINKPATDAT